MKIKQNITTPYHPAGNGNTERCHRFLNDILAKGVLDKLHSEWEDVLLGALVAIRTILPLDTLL